MPLFRFRTAAILLAAGATLTATALPAQAQVQKAQALPVNYDFALGGAAHVDKLVALAPSNHGTTLDGLTALVTALGTAGLVNGAINALCTACGQQEAGSSFLTNLNAGGETVAGVSYTVIESRYDE